MSNVPARMIRQSINGYCTEAEIDWLRNMPRHGAMGHYGLCLYGPVQVLPETKFPAMAAALIRNYVDARVFTLRQLLELEESGDLPNPTVLFIPNLFVSTKGQTLTGWQTQMLMDVLIRRMTAGRMTVVYVENMDLLAKEFGTMFMQHLKNNYVLLGA